MQFSKFAVVLIGAMFVLIGPRHCLALGQPQYIEFESSAGSFPVVQGNSVATLFADPGDYPGVLRAAKNLVADIHRVTGKDASLTADAKTLGSRAILIGTVGKSAMLDRLAKAGKIDLSSIAGQWDSFFLQVVPDPMPGISSALIIAGSNKRGTIYGIYDLSEQMGVSPWYYWADVPAQRHDQVFVKAGKYQQGEPSVKYRGIFLNDEAPDLSNWVREKFGEAHVQGANGGVANYNHEFYLHVFELILRLKGNYLWPAMWNNAFNEDDPENPKLADECGIVMGTSHQEPMLRAQKEWDRRYQRKLGSWNYYTHPDVLETFWREGIKRNKNYESIITIGLRGANDTPMIPGGTVPRSIELLEKIVGVQRKMISEEINPDPTKVPQMWCLYKEVQDYYKAGLRVPDDVTLLWSDDNWGDLRRLPTEAERKRPGGAGIYYHFDYVGGPRNYKWINTNPIAKVCEQMTLAKAYGADRIWIVNVGHFKGVELPVDYFLNLAWNTNRWNHQNIDEFTRLWAQEQFGPEHAREIADIMTAYSRFNGRRKPELLDPTTYSVTDYQEADSMVADYKAVVAKAQAIYDQLASGQRDAFYELALFPAKASAQVNELYVATAKNHLYAQQGRASANNFADQTEALFKADADLMAYFNHTFADGRWDHFMDQTHIGYTYWQEPRQNRVPRVTRLQVPKDAQMGIAIDGSSEAWPGATEHAALPRFDSLNQERHYIDIFNKGQTPFEYAASANESWIVLSSPKGELQKDQRLWVTIDWTKAPKGSASGMITLNGPGAKDVSIKVDEINPAEVTRDSLEGFAENDGYVSIEAEHYSKKIDAGSMHWDRIADYGRTLSGMTLFPVTAASVQPPKDSPCLEYKMYLYQAGKVEVQAILGPTLDFVPGRGLRYAVSFDDQLPVVIDALAHNSQRDWETSVKDSVRISTSNHTLASAGYHTLKFWMVDPAVVLEKIVVNTGGLRPSYLGPPESYHAVVH